VITIRERKIERTEKISILNFFFLSFSKITKAKKAATSQ
jgi:hypothetical protein